MQPRSHECNTRTQYVIQMLSKKTEIDSNTVEHSFDSFIKFLKNFVSIFKIKL